MTHFSTLSFSQVSFQSYRQPENGLNYLLFKRFLWI